jgi:hypothetical protein
MIFLLVKKKETWDNHKSIFIPVFGLLIAGSLALISYYAYKFFEKKVYDGKENPYSVWNKWENTDKCHIETVNFTDPFWC